VYRRRYVFCSSRRRHTRSKRDWSSDVCSSDLPGWENLELPAADAQTPARLAPGKEHQNQRQELLVARCSRARDDVALLGQVLPNVFVLLPGLAGQMIQ